MRRDFPVAAHVFMRRRRSCRLTGGDGLERLLLIETAR